MSDRRMSNDARMHIMLHEGRDSQQTAEALNQRPARGARLYTRQDVENQRSHHQPVLDNLPPSPRVARGLMNTGERRTQGAFQPAVRRTSQLTPPNPQLFRLTQAEFDAQLDALSDACTNIAQAYPGTHSSPVLEKVLQVIETIEALGGSEVDDETTRYYSLAGTANDVALLKTHGGWLLSDHLGSDEDRAHMLNRYGPDARATRIIDFVVRHPLAPDRTHMLIEQVLNEDGANALLFSSALTEEDMQWHKSLGFEPFEVEDKRCILDPKRHPEVWRSTEAGVWFYAKSIQAQMSARSLNTRRARPPLPFLAEIPKFHRALLVDMLDDEQRSMLEEVWNCLDARNDNLVLKSAAAEPDGLTSWRLGVAAADFMRHTPGADQYEVHVLANGQDVVSICVEPIFDESFIAIYAAPTDAGQIRTDDRFLSPGGDEFPPPDDETALTGTAISQSPYGVGELRPSSVSTHTVSPSETGSYDNRVSQFAWALPQNREHTDLMRRLAGTLHWIHLARIRGFLSYLEAEGYQWSDLMPAGNVDLRPAGLQQMVVNAIERGFHSGTADALNRAFGLALEAPKLRLAPTAPEHTHWGPNLQAMESQLRAAIKQFLCYLEGQGLLLSDLLPSGDTDRRPAQLEVIVNDSIALGLHPRTRDGLNKALGLELKSRQIHDEPVRREHIEVMNGLPAGVDPVDKRYLAQFLCYLESEDLRWSHLVPSGNSHPRPDRLENLVNVGIAHHGLHPRTRAALSRIFGLEVGPAGSGPVLEEHQNLMGAISRVCPSRDRSKVKGFLRYLEGENLSWESLVRRRDSAGRFIDLETEVDRGIRNEMIDSGTRAALRNAFGLDLRHRRQLQRMAAGENWDYQAL